MADNTPQDPNKSNQEPNPPTLPKEPVEKEPEDPGYSKWVEDTKDLSTAYKRYRDSSTEANKYKGEVENLSTKVKELEEEQRAIAEDYQQLAQYDPETHNRLKVTLEAMKRGELPNKQPTQINPKDIEDKAIQAADLQVQLHAFRRDYGDYIKDDGDWGRIKKYASKLAGTEDVDGKPMTLRAALKDAMWKYHRDELVDKKTLEAIAEVEQRSSASEPGNLPSGGRSKTSKSLTPEEERVAKGFGMTAEEYRKWEAEGTQS